MVKYKGIVIYRNTHGIVLRKFYFSHSIVHARTLIQGFIDTCPSNGFVPTQMIIEDIESGFDVLDEFLE